MQSRLKNDLFLIELNNEQIKQKKGRINKIRPSLKNNTKTAIP
jgi:hypothetical protein